MYIRHITDLLENIYNILHFECKIMKNIRLIEDIQHLKDYKIIIVCNIPYLIFARLKLLKLRLIRNLVTIFYIALFITVYLYFMHITLKYLYMQYFP